jgi:hypothetical protein
MGKTILFLKNIVLFLPFSSLKCYFEKEKMMMKGLAQEENGMRKAHLCLVCRFGPLKKPSTSRSGSGPL